MAVRMSLGVGRLGLIRQLLTESVLLALLGGAAGVLLSIAGIRLLKPLLANGLDSSLFRAELSWPVLTFTLAVTFVIGILFGLAPAVHATKVHVFPALKGSRSTPDLDGRRGPYRLAFGQVLVIAQIALSLVLLVGASLFAVTLTNLRATELGFNQEGLLLANVDTSRAGYELGSLKSFYTSLRGRLTQVPGVDDVTFSWSALAGGGAYAQRVTAPGAAPEGAEVNAQVIGASFFETLQIEILAGRSITEHEADAGDAVAMIDQSLAERLFPGVDPIGRMIDVQGEGELRIVGVSANARHDVVRGDARPVVYYTHTWDPHPLYNMVFELRTRGEPLSFAETLRTIVRDVNPRVAVNSIRTQTANTDSTLNREILFARLSNAFALLALVIACVGLYGTVSYGIAQRTGELGIRMALGATRSRVLVLALRQVFGLGIAGLLIGLPAALMASRFIESFLWGVASSDPIVLAGAALIVLAAIGLAGYAPAHRASNVAPMAALRAE